MTRVLVCGGRDYGVLPPGCPWGPHEAKDRAIQQVSLLWDTLDCLKIDRGITTVIHGAAKGADALAGRWARRHLIAEEPYPAGWKKHGKAAGPIRNQKMLSEGNPDLVVAFPGGRGTADMVRRARAAGIEVIEVAAP